VNGSEGYRALISENSPVALDHGEVVREARAVAAALRTRSEFADVSQHQSREIVPTKYSRYASRYAKARRSIC
jgi:hypothetical protein